MVEREVASARIGSAWRKFRELSAVLGGKHGLPLKQWGRIYQCCVRPVLLHCCETWEITVVDEAMLCGVERCMIKIICGERLVNRVSTDAFRDRVGVVVKTEDMTIQSCLQWYGHVMHGAINSQIREVTEVAVTGKRKKGQPRKSWEECVKKILNDMA